MYLEEAIKAGVRAGLLDTMISAPAIIKSFNPTLQTVTADIAIQRIVDGVDKNYTILIDIPIVFPTVQGFHITLPIKKGDEVLVIFADRCIDNWFERGGIQKQAEHRSHHISDGFAIIGINSTPNKITNYDPDNMVIRNTANNQKVTLEAGGNIVIDTVKDVNINCVKANIKASSSVAIDTPATTISGTLDVGGAITSAVSTTAPKIIAGTSLTVEGKEMSKHTHGGVQTGPSSTGVPN